VIVEKAVVGGERVAKALARAGVASRREVERLIAEGRVALNGVVLTTPAVKVGPADVLTVNGKPVSKAEPTRVWRYHKPVGLMTTHNDPKGRPTVFAHLPGDLPRVISVGRLDLNSEGLLLLTNDGGLTRALELPATGLMRRYRARAYGHADQSKLDRLLNGITIEGVVYGPIEAKLDKVQHKGGNSLEADRKAPANLWITVTLSEGKNREVRRVLEALGLVVNRLVRLSYGPFALGTLAVGEVEEVGPRVIRELLSDYIAPENLPTGDRTVGPVTASRAKGAPAPAGRRETGAAGETLKPVYKPGWAKPKKKPAIQRSKRPTRAPGTKTPKENWRGDRPAAEEKKKHYVIAPSGDTRALPKGGARKPAPARGAAALADASRAAKPGADRKPAGPRDYKPVKTSGPYRATVKGPRPTKRPPGAGGPRR
jgi:23S rRNA pseudouridine2605 synthase